MEKIFVDKNESVANVVEKVITEEGGDVTVVIPRDAAIGKSVNNFHLLKREAKMAGKNLFIESVDEDILALAKASEIKSSHPFLDEKKGESKFSDIVLRRGGDSDGESEEGSGKKKKKKPLKEPVKVTLKVPAEETVSEEPESKPEEISEKIRISHEVVRSAPSGIAPSGRKKKILAAVFVLAAVLVAGAWIVQKFFDKATVAINFEKTPWSYEGQDYNL